MLKIRKQQLKILDDHMFLQFEDRMVDHLHTQFPEQTKLMEDRQLREFIRDGVKRAAKYEVLCEPDICRYLECMLLHGIDFDTQAFWASEILNNADLDGAEKMDYIDDYEMFKLGEA